MDVRFEIGTLGTLEAGGFNDFELMSDGDTTTLYGETNNVDCSLHDAELGIRVA